MFQGVGTWVLIGLSYLALHFLLYVFLIRNRPFFQSERGIFLYHVVSIVAFALLALASVSDFSEAGIAVLCALIAAHAIYSISFLELWSLAQGGYSLSILAGAASARGLRRTGLIESFARLGDSKRDGRLSVLSKSSLVRHEGGYWRLSARGRFIANLLEGLLWLAGTKRAD
jgi:hypothetical protein